MKGVDMKLDNNNYNAPMAYCDHHMIGYPKTIGCADCNAKKIEAKVLKDKDKNKINNIISVRIFPETELQALANKGTIVLVVRLDMPKDPIVFCIGGYYLFVAKDNPHLLYTKINKDQAMEITMDVSNTELSKTTP